MADRRATVVWEGDLLEGKGQVSFDSSGFASDVPVTWASRTEDDANSKTSPEELIAGAHASCFSMALSKQLNDRGAPPQRLETSAKVTFVPGTGITTSALTVRVTAEGLDEQGLVDATTAAKDGCPVSKALAGNVEVTLDAAFA